MHKKVIGRKLCLMLLLSVLSLTACSVEELLMEVPQTLQVQMETTEDISTEDNTVMTSEEATQTEQSTNTAGEKTSFLMEEVTYFAYNSLSPAQQLWYRDMEQALGNMEEEVRLSTQGLEAGLDENCIDAIFQSVLSDHPELFFVEGYTYTKYSREDKVIAISFSGTYQMSKEEVVERKVQIEQSAGEILAGIDGQASEYDKVKYVFETIIRNTDYDLNAPDNQNIYSVFVGKSSVCQGYAKATQYLLNRLGMECTLVQGTVDTGDGHAWNLVRVDGSYYYVDTTWGDASYQLEDGNDVDAEALPEINYDYLCVTTEQLLQTHALPAEIVLPECVDMAANYYVHQGALFTTYDREQMQQLFCRAAENNQTDVTVKCGDYNCYQTIYRALIEEQEIFDYLPQGYGQVSYAHNEKQLSLTFWVTNQQ